LHLPTTYVDGYLLDVVSALSFVDCTVAGEPNADRWHERVDSFHTFDLVAFFIEIVSGSLSNVVMVLVHEELHWLFKIL
jgi:hypothetical protein